MLQDSPRSGATVRTSRPAEWAFSAFTAATTIRKIRRPVVPVARHQFNVAPLHNHPEAIAVVLEFVNPAFPSGGSPLTWRVGLIGLTEVTDARHVRIVARPHRGRGIWNNSGGTVALGYNPLEPECRVTAYALPYQSLIAGRVFGFRCYVHGGLAGSTWPQGMQLGAYRSRAAR